MDLQQIKAIVEAYRKVARPEDMARLDFFYGIWQIQGRYAESVSASLACGELPETDDLLKWYWTGKTLFSQAPVSVDPVCFARAAQELASYLASGNMFDAKSCEVLSGLSWQDIIAASSLDRAGRAPGTYLEEVAQTLSQQAGADPEAQTGAYLAGMVLSLALRPFLEPWSSAMMKKIEARVEEEAFEHERPLHCPVCASDPILARVGPTAHIKQNFRTLYCAQCGASWLFERVRCARCGSRHQEHLEYVSLEGDDMHRAHLCKECGGYIRTYFNDAESRIGFNPAVEDVMMVRLDALAAAGKLHL